MHELPQCCNGGLLRQLIARKINQAYLFRSFRWLCAHYCNWVQDWIPYLHRSLPWPNYGFPLLYLWPAKFPTYVSAFMNTKIPIRESEYHQLRGNIFLWYCMLTVLGVGVYMHWVVFITKYLEIVIYSFYTHLIFELSVCLGWRLLRFSFCVFLFFFSFFLHAFSPHLQLLFMYGTWTVAATFDQFFVNSTSVHCLRTHKFHFLSIFSLKMGPTALFTHLKIILLQWFQQ